MTMASERQCFAAFRTPVPGVACSSNHDERNAAGRGQQQVDEGVFELFEDSSISAPVVADASSFGSTYGRVRRFASASTQAAFKTDTKRLRYGLRIGERRIDLRLRRGFCCLFEISRTGIAELGGLIFLAINHDDLLGSAAE